MDDTDVSNICEPDAHRMEKPTIQKSPFRRLQTSFSNTSETLVGVGSQFPRVTIELNKSCKKWWGKGISIWYYYLLLITALQWREEMELGKCFCVLYNTAESTDTTVPRPRHKWAIEWMSN